MTFLLFKMIVLLLESKQANAAENNYDSDATLRSLLKCTCTYIPCEFL